MNILDVATALAPLTEPLELTPEEKARYARHFSLPGIGLEGQGRLKNARVLCIGAGGLGSPALLYLAAAGIGVLGVIDDDTVDASNLQRQVIHADGALGQAKTESAKDTLLRNNPGADVRIYTELITLENALDLIADYDLILDGSDNFATRYIVSDACEELGKPLVWGTISKYTAQVSTFWAAPRALNGTTYLGPTLRDLYPEIPHPDSVPTCAAAGVIGSLCGTIGSIMATEAIKLICGINRPLISNLWMYDARTHAVRTLHFTRDPQRTPATLQQTATELTAVQLTQSEETVPVVSLEEVQANPDAFALIDVRTPEERTAGHLPDMAHLPHDQILERLTQGETLTQILPALATETKTPVFYCAAGVRSARVAQALLKLDPRVATASLAGGYQPGLNT